MGRKPSYAVYHSLGAEVSKSLPINHSFEEIGRTVGITRQEAYHVAMVALGKLAYQLKRIYCDDNNKNTQQLLSLRHKAGEKEEREQRRL